MTNKKYSQYAAQFCLIAFLIIAGLQCAFGQIERYPLGLEEMAATGPANHNEGKLRWNNHDYFKTNAEKRKALNWSDYNESWDGKQFSIWGLLALSGIAHGMREAYHADPYVFEDGWNADQDGFWGSDAWKRNYHNNDPKQPHKPEYFANFGRDVWHTADEVDVFGLSLSSLGTGMRKQPWKYRAANFLIGMGIRTLFARVTYETLR